jgi:hypothetical protein
MYDYHLGGKDNFEADRRTAEAGYQAFPGVLQSVRANRAFLARMVRYLVTEAGIRQFLDIGSGLPTATISPSRTWPATSRQRRWRGSARAVTP